MRENGRLSNGQLTSAQHRATTMIRRQGPRHPLPTRRSSVIDQSLANYEPAQDGVSEYARQQQESPYYTIDNTEDIYGTNLLPSQRCYVDPWDLENYDYVRKKIQEPSVIDGYYAHETVSSSPVEENYSNYGRIQILDEEEEGREQVDTPSADGVENRLPGKDLQMNLGKDSMGQHEPMYQRLPHHQTMHSYSPMQRRPLATFGQNYCNLNCCNDGTLQKRRTNGLYEKNLNLNSRNMPLQHLQQHQQQQQHKQQQQQRQHLSLPRHLHRSSSIAHDNVNSFYSNASEHYVRSGPPLPMYGEPEFKDLSRRFPAAIINSAEERESHLFNGYEGISSSASPERHSSIEDGDGDGDLSPRRPPYPFTQRPSCVFPPQPMTTAYNQMDDYETLKERRRRHYSKSFPPVNLLDLEGFPQPPENSPPPPAPPTLPSPGYDYCQPYATLPPACCSLSECYECWNTGHYMYYGHQGMYNGIAPTIPMSSTSLSCYSTLRYGGSSGIMGSTSHSSSVSYSRGHFVQKFGLSKTGLLQIDYSCSWNDLDRIVSGRNY